MTLRGLRISNPLYLPVGTEPANHHHFSEVRDPKTVSPEMGLGRCLCQLGDELLAGGPTFLRNPGQGPVDNRFFGACQHT
jgi:hypothetical protein